MTDSVLRLESKRLSMASGILSPERGGIFVFRYGVAPLPGWEVEGSRKAISPQRTQRA